MSYLIRDALHQIWLSRDSLSAFWFVALVCAMLGSYGFAMFLLYMRNKEKVRFKT